MTRLTVLSALAVYGVSAVAAGEVGIFSIKPVGELMIMSHGDLLDEASLACIEVATVGSLNPSRALASLHYIETVRNVERERFHTIKGVDKIETALGAKDADACVEAYKEALALIGKSSAPARKSGRTPKPSG